MLYMFNFWCEYRSWPWLEMNERNFWYWQVKVQGHTRHIADHFWMASSFNGWNWLLQTRASHLKFLATWWRIGVTGGVKMTILLQNFVVNDQAISHLCVTEFCCYKWVETLHPFYECRCPLSIDPSLPIVHFWLSPTSPSAWTFSMNVL